MQPFTLLIRAVVAADSRTFVPIDAEPVQIRQHLFLGLFGGTLQVRVFDAQNEHAAVVASKQPVEQRRPRPADVQISRRAGREADAHGAHARFASFIVSSDAASAAMATTRARPSS